MNGKITIKDIARRTGVSISTVSRVINKTKPVSEELRNKVMEIINKEGYVPNHTARSLILKRTNTIGVVVPNISQYFHVMMLEGVADVLEKNGYQMLVCNIKNDVRSEMQYIDLLAEKQVDGIILMHETSDPEIKDYLSNCDIPIVMASIEIPGVDRPVVRVDDYMAACDAVEYLISLGHKEIGIICGTEITVGNFRTRAYVDVMKKYGLQLKESLMVQGNYTMESGYSAMQKILERENKVTAIFVVSDEMAIGAINCALDMGYEVPKDISVIGFDDIELSSYFRPKLTTIRQPIKDIAKISTEIIIKNLKGESMQGKNVTVKHNLIVRDSCTSVNGVNN
ncbi:MAG: LacI family transcriptional regulator [Thermoanaerobacteraceae bacterium]|nr:LacI family transcriptional regulator [Thermoanaerobacteraceae bacterium]MDK2943227.1 LacI family transcriptional regulator [Acetobacterium sp.]MDN5301177.1 LacI family transcriptional regulator [Thermoanaerobacteraceae bacterium]